MTAFRVSIVLTTVVVLVGTTASVQAQTTLILTPSQDAPIGYHDNYNSANVNYNSEVHCSPFCQPGASGGSNTGRGLMEFDLSSIPSDATVLGAFLSLSASGPTGTTGAVTSVGSTGQNSSTIRRITSAWSDNTVTWNTQPPSTDMDAVPLAQSTYSLQNYLNIDVTALVQDMVSDPDNSYGFMLKLDNETPTRGLMFYGGLAPEPDKIPSLVVVYGECGTTTVPDIEVGNDHLSLSPSVTSSGSSVQLDMGSNVTGTANLVLINALGQIIFTRPTGQWPMSIMVPALAQGTYTWKVQDAVGTALGVARMVVR